MVGYYNAYKGSTRTPVIYAGDKIVKKVYKGSQLVYQIGFDTFTVNAGASLQAWTVPPGVTKIHVDCVASKGAIGAGDRVDKVPGYGGRVQCDLAVTGGQVLYITVGAIPSSWTTASYNASDIRIGGTDYGNRVIVAGGGGSARHTSNRNYAGNGGNGGGLTGATGTSDNTGRGQPGVGGSQSAGGAGGWGLNATGGSGTLGLGGSGTDAGAGGAGYYGGGAGGFGGHDGTFGHAGGGGGSSYTNSNCSNVVHTQGYQDGAGYITISFVDTLGGD